MSRGKVTGWVLSVLVVVFLVGVSAPGKFIDFPGKTEMFEKMGLSTELAQKIGILEITLAALFLVPRTGFLAGILLTGYLGGAVMTHVRVGEAFFFPILVGVLSWFALGLRRPEVFALAIGENHKRQAGS
jgi:hypothetical protein